MLNNDELARRSTPNQSTYRPEIDGLRAFAVLSVVAFHAFPSWLKGGFIGVDVFFVISGFLITSHIFEKLDKDQFSFLDFFARRIRRIFPALIFVMATSLVFGWFVLLSDEYTQLGKHVASGAAFITNFILVNESGYFDNAAETKPMLHLWSLAVEEQFYIVWPIVLWLSWKRQFNLLAITVIVALISFSWNLQFSQVNPTVAFFWPTGRFWELLSGSILAWLLLYKSESLNNLKLWIHKYLVSVIKPKDVLTNGISNLVSFFGLLLLAYGVIRINDDLAFPSTWALIPVIGAVLIIASGPNAWLNRVFLINPISIWFGLISYPLYLWHWPILSFLQIMEGEIPHITARIAAVLLSILMAWLTYRFIERPIRFGVNNKKWVKLLVVLVVAVGSMGLFIEHRRGFGLPGIYGHGPFFTSIDSSHYPCENKLILDTSNKWGQYNRCWQSKRGEPTVILLGDSHAEHLFFGFAESLQNENVTFYIEDGRPSFNDKEFETVFAELLKISGAGKTVLITTFYLQDFIDYDLLNELREVVRKLKSLDYSIAILGDVPQFDAKPSACQTRRVYFRSNLGECEITVSALAKQVAVYEPLLKQLAIDENIAYLPTNNDLICNEKICSMVDESSLLYRDPNHLNEQGSRLFGRDFAERLLSENIID